MSVTNENLTKQVKRLMNQGIHNPEDLFHRVYNNNNVHYSRVREAVHNAKNL